MDLKTALHNCYTHIHNAMFHSHIIHEHLRSKKVQRACISEKKSSASTVIVEQNMMCDKEQGLWKRI